MDIDKLEKLSELKDKGIITQEEFDEQKKIIFRQKDSPKSNKSALENNNDKNIWNNYLSCLKKYFKFSGRATRYEYWSFILINILVSLILCLIDIFCETDGVLNGLFVVATFIPTISALVRRLHDVNKSSWNLILPYLFLLPVAFLGAIINYFGAEVEEISRVNSVKSIIYVLGPLIWYIYVVYLTCKKSDNDNKYGNKVIENEKYDVISEKLMISSILLSFVSILSIGFISESSSTSSQITLNRNIDQVIALVSNIRAAFQNYQTYDGLNNQEAKKYGLVPDDMYSDQADETIINAFGTETIIQGMDTTFSIVFTDLSEQQCIMFSTYEWGAFFSSGFAGITINEETNYESVDDYKRACSDCSEEKCSVGLVFF